MFCVLGLANLPALNQLKIYPLFSKGYPMALDPNVLTNIIPKILARGLLVLRTRCVMPRLVNSDYSQEAARKGSIIEVPIPTAVTTKNVSPGEVYPEDSVGITPQVVQVPLDNWKQNYPIHLTDKDYENIDAKETFLPMQLQEAIKALASDVNKDILAEYLGVYGYTGTAGTTPFATTVADATACRKILHQQLCPRDNRRGVIDFDCEEAALKLSEFSDAEKIMSAVVKIEGDLGRKYGIDWIGEDDVPLHTAGTLVVATCTVSGTAGQSALTIVAETGNTGETLLVGDIITLTVAAGADTQTYVIKPGTEGENGYLKATGANGGYTIPGTPFTIIVEVAPLLKSSPTATDTLVVKATHRVNLVFHRDAIAFATRTLQDSDAMAKIVGGSQILSMVDPHTGLVLRLEVSRRHKLTCWEFDILWGAKLVRPELACRLAG